MSTLGACLGLSGQISSRLSGRSGTFKLTGIRRQKVKKNGTLATLVGGSAASGVHVFKTLQGFDGVGEDVILSVRVENPQDEERVAEIFQRHGAVQIWAQNRPY